MFGIGGWEWIAILFVALLVFGRRLPEVMRNLGGGVREFRKGIDGSASADSAQDAGKSGTASEKRVEQAAEKESLQAETEKSKEA